MVKAKRILGKLLSRNEAATIIPLLIMFLVIGFVNKSFFSVGNLIDILRTTSYTFMVAAPYTCLMIAGGMDLSIGSVTSLGGIVCGWCMTLLGLPTWISIMGALLAGALIGVIKSLIVVKANLPAFIVTLGLQYVINGFILFTTSGMPITGFPSEFKVLGQGRIGGIYISTIVAIVIGIIMHVFLTKTKPGRGVFATGGNAETARLAGINVNKVQISANVIVSVFAALVGVFYASRFTSAQTNIGTGTEMNIMSAVIIGGTSLFGGSGTVIGSFLGCLLLAVINNGLIMMRVSSYLTNFIFGCILITALFIDKYRRQKASNSN